jgi:WD40 repeat protein
MTQLSGRGTRVLLIGTAEYSQPSLLPLPSVRRSVSALSDAFREQCGLTDTQLRILLDPPDAKAMAEAIAEAADGADGVLLIYYLGHGLLGPGGELYLAATGTGELRPGLAAHQALPFAVIAEAITACRAASVAVVLDCCFSGRAVLGWRAADPAFTLPATHGLYLLASAEQLALAPEDQQYTAFSGALISLLTEGDPRGPAQLTLDDAYEYTFRVMREAGGPLPRRQAGDRSGELILTRNPAWTARPAGADGGTTQAPDAGWCPYLGLSAFTVDDVGLFRGRQEATGKLVAAAAQAQSAGTPLIVVGPSGAGKSSLLHAGLLARIREAPPELPGIASWPVVTMTPGDHPLQALARHGLPAAGDQATEPVVLIVDQLEQALLPGITDSERARFLSALQAIASDQPGGRCQALVVLALRADFYGAAAHSPELLPALATSQFLLGPMTPAELRAVIEEPAQAAGLRLDDGLADLILHELGGSDGRQPGPGALPLLSHALWAIWQRRSAGRLTLDGYKAAGRVTGAIAASAGQAYRALPDAEQDAARRMLPRLVRVGDASGDVPDTSRELPRDSLLQGLPDQQAALDALDRLAAARLLTLGTGTVRLSHEALLRSWPLLAGWVRADREWLQAAQQLTDDTRAWRESAGDRSRLYRGGTLADVTAKVARAGRQAELPVDAAEFLSESTRQERRASRVRTTAIIVLSVLLVLALGGGAASLAYQRQAVAQRNSALAEFIAAEASELRLGDPNLATQLSIAAYQADPAEAPAMIASQGNSGTLDDGTPVIDMAEADGGRALVVSTGTAIQVLDRATGAQLAPASSIGSGPVATGSHGPLLVAATEPVSDLFPLQSPVPNDVNLPGKLSQLRVWSLANPAHPRQLAVLSAQAPDVDTLAVSPDGTLIAAGATDGSIHVWNAADPARPVLVAATHGTGKPVYSVTFQPRSRVLASFGDDHKVRLWDLSQARPGTLAPRPLAAIPATAPESGSTPDAIQHAAAFSADGRDLALPAGPDDEENPQVWDVSSPQAPRLLYKPDSNDASCGDLMGLAVTGTGKDLHLVSSCGGELNVWDVIETGQPRTYQLRSDFTRSTQSNDGSGGQVIVEHDHSIALSVSTDGVQVWQVAAAEPDGLASYPAASGLGAGVLAVSSSGPPLLADTSYVPFARLISLSNPSKPRTLGTYATLNDDEYNAQADSQGLGVALSGDGDLLAVSEVLNDKPVVVLRRTAAPEASPVATIRNLSDGAISLALSRDGRLLALSDNANYTPDAVRPPMVKLFSLADLAHPRLLATVPSNTLQVLLSPDGRMLVALTANLMLSWDITDPRRPRELPQVRLSPSSKVAQGSFSPDGRFLAVVDSTGALRLWRLAKQDLLTGPPVTLTTAPDVGTAVAISPDGQTMATVDEPAGSENPVVDLWSVSDPSAPHLVAQWPQGGFEIVGLAFASAGDALVVEDDQDMTIWSTNSARIERALCQSVGDQITSTQWKSYVPDLPYRPPCASP